MARFILTLALSVCLPALGLTGLYCALLSCTTGSAPFQLIVHRDETVMQCFRCLVWSYECICAVFPPRWNTPRGDRRTWSWPESILHRHSSWTTETWGLCLACIWWVAPKLKKTNIPSSPPGTMRVMQKEQRCVMSTKLLVSADSDPYLEKATLCIISVM